MKKILSLVLMGLMFSLVACQREEMSIGGEEVLKTISVSIPQGEVLTRAAGDGAQIDRCIMEIYHHDDLYYRCSVAVEDSKAEFSNIRLVTSQSYDFLFWADNSAAELADEYYNTNTADGLKNITYVTGKYIGNNDELDAFCAAETKTVTSEFAFNVELKRPFAQLNVETMDIASVANNHTELLPKMVTVKFASVPTAFNVMTGEATAKAELTYTAKITKDAQGAYLAGAKGGALLTVDYLFTSKAAEQELIDFTADFKEDETTVITSNDKFTNIPVRRNYKTNVYGNLLTASGSINVTLDPVFDGMINIKPGDDVENSEVYSVRGGDNLYKTLGEALAAGESDILLGAGEYSLNTANAAIVAENVTITGADKEKVKVSITGQIRAVDGETSLTLKNLTTEVPTGLGYGEATFGFMHYLKNFTMENCKSNGRIRLNVHNALIDNCEFNVDTQSGFDGYAIFQYGANGSTVTVKNSTFNTKGKAIVLYNESTQVLNLDVENCTFVSSEPTTDKAAIQMHTEYGITGTVNIKNSTATGFLNVNRGLWNEINNQTGAKTNNFVVSVTLADGVVQKRNVYEISNANGMMWFANEVNTNGETFSGETLRMTADIDLAGAAWEPIGQTGATQFLGTFDGQNKTIKNLKVKNESVDKNCASGLFGWIERHGNDADYLMAVKNLNVEGAKVEGHHNVAVIAGYLIGTVENCNVTDAEVVCTHANDNACGDKAGVIAGIAAEANALIKGCTAKNSTVTAGRDAGQIVGACIVGKVENCSATNVVVSAIGDCTGANINNELIGRTE